MNDQIFDKNRRKNQKEKWEIFPQLMSIKTNN